MRDLEQILAKVLKRDFPGFRVSDFTIQWAVMSRPRRKRVFLTKRAAANKAFVDADDRLFPEAEIVASPRGFTFGACTPASWKIEINESLFDAPIRFLEALIYHELLHIFVGLAHDKAFKIAERRRWADYKYIELWWVRNKRSMRALAAQL